MKRNKFNILREKQITQHNKLLDKLAELSNNVDKKKIELRQLTLNGKILSIKISEANLELGSLDIDLQAIEHKKIYEQETFVNLTRQCKLANSQLKSLKEAYNNSVREVENNEKNLEKLYESLRNLKEKNSMLRCNRNSEIFSLEENSTGLKQKILGHKLLGQQKNIAIEITELIKVRLKEALSSKNNIEKRIEKAEEAIIDIEQKMIEDRIDFVEKSSKLQQNLRAKRESFKKLCKEREEALEKRKVINSKSSEEMTAKIKESQETLMNFVPQPDFLLLLNEKKTKLASELEDIYQKIEKEKKLRINLINEKKTLRREIEDAEMEIGTAKMNLYIGNQFTRI